jgi:hypothetical protein
VDPELQSLGISLAEAAVRNTAATVADRIGAAKARKRDQETVALLEEIVNDLISDKSELTRIAQAYEQELVAQRLSATDVEYITSNIVPVLEKLAESAAGDRESADTVHEVMDVLKPILSVETVTVLQLIGFNFRKAIGEPLTDLVSRLILARAQSDATANTEIQRLAIQRELTLMQIAADPEAHARFLAMIGQR